MLEISLNLDIFPIKYDGIGTAERRAVGINLQNLTHVVAYTYLRHRRQMTGKQIIQFDFLTAI